MDTTETMPRRFIFEECAWGQHKNCRGVAHVVRGDTISTERLCVCACHLRDSDTVYTLDIWSKGEWVPYNTGTTEEVTHWRRQLSRKFKVLLWRVRLTA